MREACNLYQQNGNSVCFPVAAPILHHQASTWLPSWSWACTAALMLSSLVSLPFCYHQAQTCGNTMAICEKLPKHPDFHLKGLSKILPHHRPTVDRPRLASARGCAVHKMLKSLHQGTSVPLSTPQGQEAANQELKYCCPCQHRPPPAQLHVDPLAQPRPHSTH